MGGVWGQGVLLFSVKWVKQSDQEFHCTIFRFTVWEGLYRDFHALQSSREITTTLSNSIYQQ